MRYYFSSSDGAKEARRCLLDALNDISVSAPSCNAKDQTMNNLQFILRSPEYAYIRNRDDEADYGCDRSFDIRQEYGKPFETREWGTIRCSVRFSWNKMYDEHLEIRFYYTQSVNGARKGSIESGYNTIIFFRKKVKRYFVEGYDQITLFEN